MAERLFFLFRAGAVDGSTEALAVVVIVAVVTVAV
jgi:hypothetical protein